MGNSRLGRRKGYNGTLLERFERLYIPEPNSGCWLWLGSLAGEGYAQKFGVHLRTIFKAKSGETWKHLA